MTRGRQLMLAFVTLTAAFTVNVVLLFSRTDFLFPTNGSIELTNQLALHQLLSLRNTRNDLNRSNDRLNLPAQSLKRIVVFPIKANLTKTSFVTGNVSHSLVSEKSNNAQLGQHFDSKSTHLGIKRPSPMVASSTARNTSSSSSSLPKGRFPVFGTREFNETCSWALHRQESNAAHGSKNCTIWVQPPPNYGEGISAWFSLITSGFLMAMQTNCSIRIAYAQGVNLSEFIIPTGIIDWTVPSNSTVCTLQPHQEQQQQQYLLLPNCSGAQYAYARGGGPDFRHVRPVVAAVPPFRTPHVPLVKSHETDLKRTLGATFHIETSMACSTGVLFQLSPSLTHYQPNLFNTILPTLWDPTALVLSLYIRTGHTEALHVAERVEKYQSFAERIAECALYVEQLMESERQSTNGSNSNSNSQPRKVVWMLLTDSPFVKQFITESYSNTNSTTTQNNGNLSRTILITQARGAHTKGSPSTADVAEGFLDWYLIGESDVVISDHYAPSFGNTASFRTARPHYKVPKGVGLQSNNSSNTVCLPMEPSMEFKL